MRGLLATAALAVTLSVSAAPAAEPQSWATVAHVQPNGDWLVLALVARGTSTTDEIAGIKPVLTFVPEGGGGSITRRLSNVWVEAPPGEQYTRVAFRLVKGPPLPGTYGVHVELRQEADVVSTADAGSIRIVGLGSFLLLVIALFGALLSAAAVLAARGRSRRVRLSAGAALLITVPLWVPMLLAGYAAFLGLALLLTWLARRATTADAFLVGGTCATVAFLEVYWGTVVNGAYITAPIVSLTLLYLVYRGVDAALRRRPGARKWTIYGLGVALTGLYLSMSLYKAFFRDYPALMATGNAGQIGDILDSTWHVFRTTHALTAALPIVLLVIYLRKKPRVRLPAS